MTIRLSYQFNTQWLHGFEKLDYNDGKGFLYSKNKVELVNKTILLENNEKKQ